MNRGQKILVRLRYATDKNQFLPMEQVVDTMLHELAHIVFGPHDEKFHALWDQLRSEYEALVSKGYTGEGFLSKGQRVGGRRVPRDEARRIARAAAEKRQALSAGSGQKLGGTGIRVGQDVRKVIADAAERRIKILKGCGSDNNNFTEREVINLTEEADEAGFKTQAEEDEANDRAIAQALWELVQEDEKSKYGNDYVAPTAQNPSGSQGGPAETKLEKSIPRGLPPFSALTFHQGAVPSSSSSQRPPQSSRPQSRLVTDSLSSTKKPKTTPSTSKAPSSTKQSEYFIPLSPTRSSQQPEPSTTQQQQPPLTGWTCEICTLHNPINYLCCDACTTERPESVTAKILRGEVERKKKEKEREALAAKQSSGGSTRSTWRCGYCTNVMESQWWTCSACGQMKATS